MKDANKVTDRAGRLHPGLRPGRGTALIVLMIGLAAEGAAQAAPINPVTGPVSDKQGDILPTFNVVPNPGPDLDVRSIQVLFNPSAATLTLIGQMWGAIGQTPGAIYAWGIDRGPGTQQFLNSTPVIGAGVTFDTVFVVRPDGTTSLSGVSSFITSTATPNDTITAIVPTARLIAANSNPDILQWGFNLWPRIGLGQNVQVADFAPDAADVLPTAVPEPLSLIAMGTGLVGVLSLSAWRRLTRMAA